MELNNKEDVDQLVITSSNVETKIKNIQDNIDNKLRPILAQLNEEGEPSLIIAQDKSIVSNTSVFNSIIKIINYFYILS